MRRRKLFDLVLFTVAVAALAFGIFDYAVSYGWRGIIIGTLTAAVGFLAANMLYPLWFSGD